MLELRLSPEELDFMETLYNPVAAAECLFSDLESPNFSEFDERCSEVRWYQYLFMSFEYLIDYDLVKIGKKAAFRLREMAGSVYALCGRLIGKTIMVESVDILLSMLLMGNERVGLTSLDLLHIRGVIEDVIRGLEHHPIYALLNPKITRSPNYRIELSTGYLLESVNQNLSAKLPGVSFHQKHFSRLYSEECSYETDEVFKKRAESVGEYGCVIRASGMTNFTRYSPIGRIFYSLEYKPHVVNMPQLVSPAWDARAKRVAMEKHSGEETASYRIYVMGQVIEEGLSVLDMERVRRHYLDDKTIKHFEVGKDQFERFRDLIIIDKMKNAEKVWIAADIGESAPTEIAIFFQIPTNDLPKYRYAYNITLYNLTDKQQEVVFEWIASQLGAHFVAIDTTEGTGRAIFRRLEESIGKEHMVWVSFNEKLIVGFEKDQKG